MKSTKQVFKIRDKVTIWWKPILIQGKFVLRRRELFEIVAILYVL